MLHFDILLNCLICQQHLSIKTLKYNLSDCSPETGNWQLTVTLLLLRGVQWCPVAEVHGQVQWQTVHPRWQLVGHPPPTVMWTTNFPFQVPFLRLQLGLLLPFYCLIDLQFSTISYFNYFLWKRIYFIIKECTSQDGLVVAIDKGW